MEERDDPDDTVHWCGTGAGHRTNLSSVTILPKKYEKNTSIVLLFAPKPKDSHLLMYEVHPVLDACLSTLLY